MGQSSARDSQWNDKRVSSTWIDAPPPAPPVSFAPLEELPIVPKFKKRQGEAVVSAEFVVGGGHLKAIKSEGFVGWASEVDGVSPAPRQDPAELWGFKLSGKLSQRLEELSSQLSLTLKASLTPDPFASPSSDTLQPGDTSQSFAPKNTEKLPEIRSQEPLIPPRELEENYLVFPSKTDFLGTKNSIFEAVTAQQRPERRQVIEQKMVMVDGVLFTFFLKEFGSKPPEGFALYIGLHGKEPPEGLQNSTLSTDKISTDSKNNEPAHNKLVSSKNNSLAHSCENSPELSAKSSSNSQNDLQGNPPSDQKPDSQNEIKEIRKSDPNDAPKDTPKDSSQSSPSSDPKDTPQENPSTEPQENPSENAQSDPPAETDPMSLAWEAMCGVDMLPEGSIWLVPKAPNSSLEPWNSAGVDQFLGYIIDCFSILRMIDTNRVYLIGQGAGADGVFKVGGRMADRFAAVAAVGGDAGASAFLNFRNLPLAVLVVENPGGGIDQRHILASNRRAQKSLARLNARDPFGYNVKFQRVTGPVHPAKTRLALGSLFTWISAFRRSPLPSKVVWRQCSDVLHGSLYFLKLEPTAIAKGAIVACELVSPNEFSLKVFGVRRLWILLSQAIVDFRKPVKVIVNGSLFFQDFVRPSEEAVAHSLADKADPELLFQAEILVQCE